MITKSKITEFFESADISGWSPFFYAYKVANLNMKNFTSDTPLNWLLKALIFALKDSADALVRRSSK